MMRSATASPALFLFLCLMLTAPSKAVTAGECLGCPKIVFERTKPPRIKYHSVCPSISCGAPEHFGYYPTCWTAWPFPPDYSHCPCPPTCWTADRQWIVGTWRSYKLDYGDFGECKGAKQIELVAASPDEIGLFLIFADGKRSRAGDTEPCLMDDKKLFFGPIGSGLRFNYRRASSDELILDLKSGKIHVDLRREKK